MNPNYNIVVTGHSLGGGAATVTGVLLHETLKKTHNVKSKRMGLCGHYNICGRKRKNSLTRLFK